MPDVSPAVSLPPNDSIYRGSYASIPAYTLRPPQEGNRTIPVTFNWLASGAPPNYAIHFNARQQLTHDIRQICALHVDNTQCSSSVHVVFPDTQFQVVLGPNLQGYYPVITSSLEFFAYIDKTPLAQDVTVLQVLNFMPPPIEFGTQAGGGVGTVREIDTVAPLQGGPITDIGTVSLSTPLQINYGGTGAVTAAAALDNLSGASGTTAGSLQRSGTGTWSVVAGAAPPYSVSLGGTGQTTLTNQKLLVGAGTSPIASPAALTWDGATLSVSLNATAPGSIPAPAGPTAARFVGADATNSQVVIEAFGAGNQAQLTRTAARGTAAAPAAIQAGDVLGTDNFNGYDGAAFGFGGAAQMLAAEAWSASAHGTTYGIYTIAPGTTGGTYRMRVKQGAVIGNDAPDPGHGALTISQNAAAALPAPYGGHNVQLRIAGSDNAGPAFEIDSYGAGQSSFLQFSNTRGTAAAPSATGGGDYLGLIDFYGRGPSAYTLGARIIVQSADNPWSSTANGTVIVLSATPPGTSALQNVMTLSAGVQVNGAASAPPAGGDLGPGTINAAAQIKSSGAASAILFDDRGAPGAANQFAWYANGGIARLNWAPAGAGADILLVDAPSNLGRINPRGGYRCQPGAGAAAGNNTYNVSWPGSGNPHIWIDTTDFGTIQTVVSDARLKTDIRPAKADALAAINRLALVEFSYKEKRPTGMPPHKRHSVGFTAQDVAKVIPEAVSEGEGKDAELSLQLLPLVAHLARAVQQLSARIDQLEKRR